MKRWRLAAFYPLMNTYWKWNGGKKSKLDRIHFFKSKGERKKWDGKEREKIEVGKREKTVMGKREKKLKQKREKKLIDEKMVWSKLMTNLATVFHVSSSFSLHLSPFSLLSSSFSFLYLSSSFFLSLLDSFIVEKLRCIHNLSVCMFHPHLLPPFFLSVFFIFLSFSVSVFHFSFSLDGGKWEDWEKEERREREERKKREGRKRRGRTETCPPIKEKKTCIDWHFVPSFLRLLLWHSFLLSSSSFFFPPSTPNFFLSLFHSFQLCVSLFFYSPFHWPLCDWYWHCITFFFFFLLPSFFLFLLLSFFLFLLLSFFLFLLLSSNRRFLFSFQSGSFKRMLGKVERTCTFGRWFQSTHDSWTPQQGQRIHSGTLNTVNSYILVIKFWDTFSPFFKL